MAGISLLAGGIGSMNIMLVSVTEHASEIGIGKAVGARRCDHLGHFLIETIVLSLAGGALIALAGAGISATVNLFGLKALVEANALLLAVGVAVGIGVGFGLYPARQAAHLHPIEALPYE